MSFLIVLTTFQHCPLCGRTTMDAFFLHFLIFTTMYNLKLVIIITLRTTFLTGHLHGDKYTMIKDTFCYRSGLNESVDEAVRATSDSFTLYNPIFAVKSRQSRKSLDNLGIRAEKGVDANIIGSGGCCSMAQSDTHHISNSHCVCVYSFVGVEKDRVDGVTGE